MAEPLSDSEQSDNEREEEFAIEVQMMVTEDRIDLVNDLAHTLLQVPGVSGVHIDGGTWFPDTTNTRS